ncbi:MULTISPECIES: hypothetical protein [Providencia]|uniref:Uncharacterized protein n=1 Tax=Providencia heimbachae ATCC 35613 TaxID=1354272 RepID=A0A1B7JR79_9GAMM|nr:MULTISPECIES: hypothetical protein [Providencia]MBP6123555.1 hypothetical protein [Providencia sp.]MDD9339364.1 hypothetical protein [Providencia heimbachae]NIH21166.1 hypothetical protein [Providencia heimbachae]OAT50413.1 hypothetical protein M998_2575 [Providencia heimbachae ATCC 35613]QCJ68776.1 hypothetical protein C9446_02130 [Providencia heimbachae]
MSNLTKEQEEYVDDLAMQRVFNMNNDDVFVNALEQKIHQMEDHLKTYFHERVNFHQQNKK